MPRLNVAVEAACQTGGPATYEAGKGTTTPDDMVFLSIYVTDENREPVTGLKKSHFTITFLAPPGMGKPGVFTFFDDKTLGLPAVYIAEVKLPLYNMTATYAVEVKLPASKVGPARKGFGMATALWALQLPN